MIPEFGQVSFEWKNPDLLIRNPDFLLNNVEFIINAGPHLGRHDVSLFFTVFHRFFTLLSCILLYFTVLYCMFHRCR